MSFHYFIIFVSLWTATDQSVLISGSQVNYLIEPKYGNVTLHAGNSTHHGQVDLWFHTNVPNFTLNYSFEDKQGKVIHETTYSPCNRKHFNTMIRMMTMVTGGKMTKKDVSVTWNCPIRKGLTIVKANARSLKLSLFVTSFLATEGNFIYKLCYKTSGKKSEIFMKVVTRYTVQAIKD